MPGRPLTVFAVEDTAAQVCWPSLRGRHVVTASASEVAIDGDGGPGAAVLEGLRPQSRHVLRLDGRPVGSFRTLAPPPGRLLCRFATLTDLHVGDRRFGAWIPIGEKRTPGQEPFALRCARAGLLEALAWGAEMIVLKGDLTRWGTRDEFDAVGRLLAELPVPVVAISGNHDMKRSAVDAVAALRAHGVTISAEPAAVDLPGMRIVLAQTAERDGHHGRIGVDQRATVAQLAAAAPAAVCVVCHHHLQRIDPVTSWPPGVPASESRALLDELAAANPAALVTTGHTHRYRRRRHGPVLITTTGSPKDYPGAWTGYAVHEGGIRQVVRRIAAPDCIRWTQRTAHALFGGWALWAPGMRSHRCFTHPWPAA